jgi:hypothetical protein
MGLNELFFVENIPSLEGDFTLKNMGLNLPIAVNTDIPDQEYSWFTCVRFDRGQNDHE